MWPKGAGDGSFSVLLTLNLSHWGWQWEPSESWVSSGTGCGCLSLLTPTLIRWCSVLYPGQTHGCAEDQKMPFPEPVVAQV